MTTSQSHNLPTDSVRVHKLIRAPIAKVYDAWMQPELRKQWWAGDPSMTCTMCEIDVQVGGSYRINMVKGDDEYVAVGEILELDPPRKMVFSWTWEGSPLGENSVVTVDLIECEFEGNPATEVVLTHDRLDSPMARSEHNSGWAGCMRSLGFYFHGQQNTTC